MVPVWALFLVLPWACAGKGSKDGDRKQLLAKYAKFEATLSQSLTQDFRELDQQACEVDLDCEAEVAKADTPEGLAVPATLDEMVENENGVLAELKRGITDD